MSPGVWAFLAKLFEIGLSFLWEKEVKARYERKRATETDVVDPRIEAFSRERGRARLRAFADELRGDEGGDAGPPPAI